MSYTLPDLTEALAKIANEKLPRFSGQNKLLEVVVQFYYGISCDGGLFTNNQPDYQYIKVLFWHPNNAMLVAYDFESHVEDIGILPYIVASNHSSTWQHDGLNFFSKILEKPKSHKILSEKIIDIEDALATEKEFTYSVRKETVQ